MDAFPSYYDSHSHILCTEWEVRGGCTHTASPRATAVNSVAVWQCPPWPGVPRKVTPQTRKHDLRAQDHCREAPLFLCWTSLPIF